MRINHNIASLNTYRQLTVNSANGSKSLEKLSSGLRINRAGDDAAGLAISEKMRGQIRGLNQASSNAQDGISMIQTAEGALNETHSILQRMRELAVQASNSTNNETDRGEIQKEMNQLTSEINRIGNTTEFNTQKLLKGGAQVVGTVGALTVDTPSDLGTVTGAVGAVAYNNDYAAGSPGSAAFLEIGGVRYEAATAGVAGNSFSVTIVQGSGTSVETGGVVDVDGNLTITLGTDSDSAALSVTAADIEGLTFTGAGDTLITATAVTGETGQSEVSKTDLAGGADEVTATPASYDFNITANFAAGDTISFDGTTLTAGTGFTIGADANATAATIAGALAAGTTNYTVSESGGTITLTQKTPATPGAAPTVTVAGPGATEGVYSFALSTNMAAGESITIGSVTLAEGTDFTVGADADATAAAIATALSTEGTYTATATGSTIEITEATASGNDLTGADISITPADGGGFTSQLQIGANTAQSFTIEINDMRAVALEISVGDNTTAKTVTVDGKAYNVAWTTTTDVTNGTDNTGAEYALDVSSHDNATAAIKVLDDAINTVSAERSKLGAYQNRLEHTINNLGTSSENLTAAESRIRDVDMAKEMMEFTKNNILQQAAQAMLAQANQQPQGVLQLLR